MAGHASTDVAIESVIPPSGEQALVAVGEAIDGRYDVVEVLGDGGMGVVYLAREQLLDRPVAIKTIVPRFATHPEFKRRFLREAQAMSRIRHANVVQLYTVGTHEQAYFLAMEFVRGASLDTILERHVERGERLSIHVTLAILADVIDGVSSIHDADLLHCDLKPGNVVVEEHTGRPVIIDFGLATVAHTQRANAGSPAYACPEQTSGEEPLSEQSDIYALGVTAYEMLTGCLPYLARSRDDLVAMHRALEVPAMAELFADLAPFDPVVRRAMAKRPADRFTSCAEMGSAFAEARLAWAGERAFGAPAERPPGKTNEIGVVIVDDDPHFRRAATRAARLAFQDELVRVLPAADGEQAISVARRRMPTIILLDYQLPELDGVATLNAIRSLPRGRDVRVIVISGALEQVRWRFEALGVTEFLEKPVGLEVLIDAMQALAARAPS
jgi:CheY-like chemotaxis protein/tRNA A-37 threonylcarbamoyl transferase component Bud32